MILRWYQTEAIKAVYAHLEEHEDNPCVVMPTGAGKSPTIAKIAQDVTVRWGGRALILAHRKELLEQNAEKLWAFDKDLDVGIYSAGLGRRDSAQPIILAGIQSVYKRAEELGSFNIIMVDEAHRIPMDGEGMYRSLIEDLKKINPGARVIGFTATPFRAKSGEICTPGGILNKVVYDVSPGTLVSQSFLTKLVSFGGAKEGRIDTDGVGTVGGDYVLGQLEMKALYGDKIEKAVADLIKKTEKLKKILIFTCGIAHCDKVALELAFNDQSVEQITSKTDPEDRATRLLTFRLGGCKFLVNVGVFTEGLDVPDIDGIALMRPTKSPGLYVQMVGRGFRVAEGKDKCVILDYGDNVLRHGPIDAVKAKKKGKGMDMPAKECPECFALLPMGTAVCPECGYAFPPPRKTGPDVNTSAGDLPIMKSDRKPEWVEISKVDYYVHEKWGGDSGTPKTVRVEYVSNLYYRISEWVCVEHDGYARTKAMKWWGARQKDFKKVRCPESAEEAVRILRMGAMREPGRILVLEKTGQERFDVIKDYELRLNDGSLMSDLEKDFIKDCEQKLDDEVPF